MAIAFLAFLAVFLLISSVGLLLFYRGGAMYQRMVSVITPQRKKITLMSLLQEIAARVGALLRQFERALPKSEAEVSLMQQRLSRAGYRNESAPKMLYGVKTALPFLLCLIAFVTGAAHFSPFFIYVLCLAAGYLAPDFWLGKRIKARQQKVRRGLPDVLDLLIICIEAGLSLDQATARAAEELRVAQPVLSDELHMVALEHRAGRPRADCWKNFADRTGVESVRSIAAVLIQSEKFGTSVAKSLRVHSETLRTQRRQQIEERAAKTSVKLVFPLVFLIFPSIFVVTLGPAVLIMMEAFSSLRK